MEADFPPLRLGRAGVILGGVDSWRKRFVTPTREELSVIDAALTAHLGAGDEGTTE
jgi:hypothetical protein